MSLTSPTTWIITALSIIIGTYEFQVTELRNNRVKRVDPIRQDKIDAMDNLICALDIERTGLLEEAHKSSTSKSKKAQLIRRAAQIEVRISKLSEQVIKEREEQ